MNSSRIVPKSLLFIHPNNSCTLVNLIHTTCTALCSYSAIKVMWWTTTQRSDMLSWRKPHWQPITWCPSHSEQIVAVREEKTMVARVTLHNIGNYCNVVLCCLPRNFCLPMYIHYVYVVNMARIWISSFSNINIKKIIMSFQFSVIQSHLVIKTTNKRYQHNWLVSLWLLFNVHKTTNKSINITDWFHFGFYLMLIKQLKTCSIWQR